MNPRPEAPSPLGERNPADVTGFAQVQMWEFPKIGDPNIYNI